MKNFRIDLDKVVFWLLVIGISLIVFSLKSKAQTPLYQHQLYKVVYTDGTVGINTTGQSLSYLLGSYGATSTGLDVASVADINGDSVVNIADLLEFLGQYDNVLYNEAQSNCGNVSTFDCWYIKINDMPDLFPDGMVVWGVYYHPGLPFREVYTSVGTWWWFENQ